MWSGGGAAAFPAPIVSSGWSTFTPTLTTTQLAQQGSGYSGTGTRFVYVSSSTGNDSNTGTQASPVATVAHGVTLIRSGSPDWLLLKKGDTWTSDTMGLTAKTGPGVITNADGSYSGIILVTSYPSTPGPRPLMQIPHSSNTAVQINNDTAIVGIELYCYDRDPNNGSFSSGNEASTPFGVHMGLATTNTWNLIEDSQLSYFFLGISYQSSSSPATGTFILNRCQILGSYVSQGGATGCQGILYSGLQNPIITGCYFDQCGWNPQLGIPTDNNAQIKNRDGYIQSNASAASFNSALNIGGGCGPETLAGNIVLLSVAEGFQCRSGSTVGTGQGFYNNMLAFSAMGSEFGHDESGHPECFQFQANYNVSVNVVDLAGITGASGSISSSARGYSYSVAACSGSSCTFQFNIAAHGKSQSGGYGFNFTSGAETGTSVGNGIILNNNIMYNVAHEFNGSLTGSNTTTPNIVELDNLNSGGYQAPVTNTDPIGYYYTTVLGGSGATVPTGLSYISTGVQGFRNAWWGTPGVLNGQCKDNWNTNLTAAAFNDWYRGVFNSIIPAQGGF